MSEHCPACRIARELTEHRDACEVDWNQRRAAFNFAIVLAKRACPAYQKSATSDPTRLETGDE